MLLSGVTAETTAETGRTKLIAVRMGVHDLYIIFGFTKIKM